ncbi:glycosyltransferase family 39 protein [Herbivorax sp. ANBcel31]|uniref:glycosyltransferase family 39 protein n=1 Tax=Herbivorax sp. ANBcel31 TaxID=3069754 RepID=UPI0027B70A6F|nr:glycosyltransferase family 39 protein [Herbivorax sp. ANBcel31]MDQ2086086.1 glycosyltransferase family 39 protein [Herbivorax sp. ANBcel31]
MSKKNFKFFLIAIVFCMYIASSNGFAQTENLLENPTFELSEKDAEFWDIYTWFDGSETTEFGLDETVNHTDSRSAYIKNISSNDARYIQHIPVKGNTLYKFSCWIKTENVSDDSIGANLSILYTHTHSRSITGTTEDWEYVEFYGKTSPNQETVTLSLSLGGHNNLSTGKAWFDNVEMVEIDDLPSGSTALNLDPDNLSQSDATDENGDGVFSKILLIILAFTILGYIAFIIYQSKKSTKDDNSQKNLSKTKKSKKNTKKTGVPDKLEIFKVQFDIKDLIIMVVMTVIYLFIALYNLGDLEAPTTSWKSSSPGENFTIDLGKDATLSRVYYFTGLGGGNIHVEYLDEDQTFSSLVTIEKEHPGDTFKWDYEIVQSVTTRKLRFTFESSNITLNEIAIVERESEEPLPNITIVDKDVNPQNEGNLDNLFDEQDKFVYRPSFMNSMYLDEIYHGRTAFEHVHAIYPYETTHPPLGKVFMSLGVLIFGMVPFGWRIMGTLFGAAMIPAMYAFGKKVFHSRFFAFSAAFLIMFDLMHFAQTRIATIDSYVTFFVILMYYYMYDYFVNKSYALGFKTSLKPLFLSGLFFGFGAASKWIAFYGAAGLALLFFINKSIEYKDYWQLSQKKQRKPDWFYKYKPLHLYGTMGLCVIFFVIIPGIIYSLSYIPLVRVPSVDGFGIVIDNFKEMLSYHSGLEADHVYESPWWEWPFMTTPMAFYFGNGLPSGVVSRIYTLGNPAIWWTGIVAFVSITVMSLTKVTKPIILLFILSVFSFGYISIPEDFIPSAIWIMFFILLTSSVLIFSNFGKKLVISSIASAGIFSTIVYTFSGVEKTRDYYTSSNVQTLMWMFMLTAIAILLIGLFKFDRKFFPIVVAMIFQYVPWVGVPRCTFIYHYFTIVPFLILCILYVIKKITDKWPNFKYFTYIYLTLVLITFILFYPIVSGMHINDSYLNLINWVWNF